MHQTLNNNGGTSYHKDIWRKIMTKIHEGMSDPAFRVPATVEQAQICPKSGKLALSGVCIGPIPGEMPFIPNILQRAQFLRKCVMSMFLLRSVQNPDCFLPNTVRKK